MKNLDDYLNKRAEVYKKSLNFSIDGKPSWYKRNVKEIQDIMMQPDIVPQIIRLSLCDTNSLVTNRVELIAAFYYTYNLSVEYAERIVDFAITKNKTVLLPGMQNAGIHFFSNQTKTAGVTTVKTAHILYDHIQEEFGKERPSTIYLRIGPSATKEDVKDYVDFFWDKYIQPLRDAELHKAKQLRSKPKLLRDTEVYAHWKEGKTYVEIQRIIDNKYGEFLTDPDLRKIVERIKPKTKILENFTKQFDELYPQVAKSNKKLVLKSIETNHQDIQFKLNVV